MKSQGADQAYTIHGDSKNMSQYKFIAVQGYGKKGSCLSGSTRSHAIRGGLRRKTNSSNLAKHPSLSSKGPTGISDLTKQSTSGIPSINHTRTESTDVSAEGSAQSAPLFYRVDAIADGRVDPFNCLPIAANSETDKLVKYFLNRFELDLSIVDRKRAWFPYALQNQAMMHSTLAMTAAFWRAEYPALTGSLRLEGIRQKSEAIRELRASLAMDRPLGASKQMSFLMSAMSTLAIVELFDGDFMAAKGHFEAAKAQFSKDVDSNTKSDFILCKAINLSDIHVAIALGHRLTLPLLHTNQDYLPHTIIERALQPPLHPSVNYGGARDPVRIFIQLRQLLLARDCELVSKEALRDRQNVIDDEILEYLYPSHAKATCDADRRANALVLAAHIFMHLTLRQVPSRSPIICQMCVRLQDAIMLGVHDSKIWDGHEAALLWIAFVGLMGTNTGNKPSWNWFLLFLSSGKRYSQDSGYMLQMASIREVFRAFLWDEKYCQPVFTQLPTSNS